MLVKPARVLVPEVVGMSAEEATIVLKSSGLGVVTQSESTIELSASGKVIRQDPLPGMKVAKMSVVTLVVAKGPEPVTVPDLGGQTRSAAEDHLRRLGLQVEFREAKSATVPIGRVIEQSPKAGEGVAPGSLIVLTISSGEGDALEVPDVVGLSLDEARSSLERLGFSMVTVQAVTEDFRQGDPVLVVRQEPAAGASATAGSKVTVFIPIVAPAKTGTDRAGQGGHAPRLEGLTVGAAKELAGRVGVIVELADSADDAEVVTFQDPAPGDPLSGDAPTVVVKVAKSAVVPNLNGLSQKDAQDRLMQAGLTLGRIDKVQGTVAGEVLDQDPRPGIEVVSGTRVNLIISDPKAPASPSVSQEAKSQFTPAPWVD